MITLVKKFWQSLFSPKRDIIFIGGGEEAAPKKKAGCGCGGCGCR